MSNKRRFLPIIVVLLHVGMLCACGGVLQGTRDAEGFPSARELTADSVAIDEILQVNDMVLCGDYAVIYSPKTSKVLWRYRLPDWTFVDSSLVSGEGPDDLSRNSRLLPADPASNTLWVSEPMRQRFCRYDLSATVRKTSSIPGRRSDWIYGAQLCGDSLAVYGKFDFSTERYWLRVMSLADSLRATDSLRCLVKSETHSEGNATWARLYNAPVFAVGKDGRMALWYNQTETMVVCRITPHGRLEPENTFGQPSTQQEVESIDFDALKRDYNETIAAVSDRYILMLRTQYDRVADDEPDLENPRKIEALEIKVYDWDMNPVARFRLDHPKASRVLVDSERGRIYAYDPSEDFEQVYTYRFDL